ncbi:MAG TPA: carboxypeptidase-like regulatory domain-containing protein [Candidatus Solibacter sp.]|nr:carboxypeptidase-like regulatory domain-containing protein [Candidatus Solibacter sp.]
MKVLIAALLIVSAGSLAIGQDSANTAKPQSRASVVGVVTREPGSEPVKKALIELIAENQADGGNYTATSGVDGTFQIEGILPGRYRLFAERPGYLEASKHRARSEGRVLTLTGGQELKDVQIRMQAAAVVRGRVTDEDGEPMPDAQVSVMRQTYIGGHSRWEQVGGEHSNDLGEFRVANLAAGNYFVSVSPPPDFKSLIMSSGGADPHSAAEKSSTTYQTIYYPGTPDRSQATAIPLHAGDEFPMNFSLTPSPSLSVRGSVTLPAGSTASIMLQSRDFNLVLNGADVGKDGSFVIRDVSPGNYTIVATVEGGRSAMMARQTLQVTASDVDGLRLQPQAGSTIRGKLRLESRGGSSKLDLSQLFLDLRPSVGEDDGPAVSVSGTLEEFAPAAHAAPDGSFEWTNVPAGKYFVQIEDGPANGDWFLKSAAVGGRETVESGLNVSGGALTVDALASASGGVVEGVALDDQGQPMANAVIVAAPEARLRTHVERYRRAMSDQSGHFTLHGISPGEYTLFAWESVDGEAYYSPEFLKGYEEQGTAIHVGEGDRKSVKLVAIPVGEEP